MDKKQNKIEKSHSTLVEILTHDEERSNPPGVHIPPEKEMSPPQLG